MVIKSKSVPMHGNMNTKFVKLEYGKTDVTDNMATTDHKILP
jgi:hypothetical protein